METNGQEICRLELHSSQTRLMQLKFNAYMPLAFPLKLLVLASAVRLAALLSSPSYSNTKISKRSKSIPKNFETNTHNGGSILVNGRILSNNLTQHNLDIEQTQNDTNTHYEPTKSYCTIA